MIEYPIARQLSEEDKDFLTKYDKALYNSKNIDEIDNSLKILIKRTQREDLVFPGTWLESLHRGIKNNLPESPDDFPTNPLSSYVNRIKIRYSGAIIGMGGLENLKRMGEDTQEPHYDWLLEIDKEIKSMMEESPELKRSMAFSYFLNAEDQGINFDTFKTLMKNMEEEGYSPSMDKRDYVNWYVKSSEFFNEDETINPEKTMKMARTLSVWTADSEYNNETLEWLTRNYEVHPLHEKQIDKWARKIVEKQKELSVDSNLEM